jgi:hypothetical protein|tara:strand:- start:4238 stop:4429 length:192 start_codon:yes stop_codon:yes gene_type:complete
MPGVAKEDVHAIRHINYVSDSIHQFGDDIYEDLMDRDNKEAVKKAQDLIKVLTDLIQSLTDEI